MSILLMSVFDVTDFSGASKGVGFGNSLEIHCVVSL